MILGSLSKDVFERCTSTGSEVFSLFIVLDAKTFIVKFHFSYKEDLLESLNQTTAQWYKKSTSGWRPSLKNAVA